MSLGSFCLVTSLRRFKLAMVRVGNGTPLQYSCLENPMDGGAWWAAVHAVARVRHDWEISLSLFTFMHWRRKWQPTPVFLPGESQGREAWWAAVYGVAQSRTRLKQCSSSSSKPKEKEGETKIVKASSWNNHWICLSLPVEAVHGVAELDTTVQLILSLFLWKRVPSQESLLQI